MNLFLLLFLFLMDSLEVLFYTNSGGVCGIGKALNLQSNCLEHDLCSLHNTADFCVLCFSLSTLSL